MTAPAPLWLVLPSSASVGFDWSFSPKVDEFVPQNEEIKVRPRFEKTRLFEAALVLSPTQRGLRRFFKTVHLNDNPWALR